MLLNEIWMPSFARPKMIVDRWVCGGEEVFSLSEQARAYMFQVFCERGIERKSPVAYIASRNGLPELADPKAAKALRTMIEAGSDVHMVTGPQGAQQAQEHVERFNSGLSHHHLTLWRTESDPQMFFCILKNGELSCVYYELDLPSDRGIDGCFRGHATALCGETYLASFLSYIHRNQKKQIIPCLPSPVVSRQEKSLQVA